MFAFPKLTLTLTLGALAISAPAMADPAGRRDGFGPNDGPSGTWNNDDGFDNRDGFDKFDRDGRGHDRAFPPAFDKRGHLAQRARMQIQLGHSLVDQGKALVRYGHRSHQWRLVAQGRELQARGERFIHVGWALAREARAVAFR